MAFPTTSVLDAFNRANGLLVGGNWSNDTFNFGAGSTALTINTNQVAPENASYGEVYWNPTTFGPDSEVFVTYAVAAHNGGDWGVGLRVTNPDSTAVDGYRCAVFQLAGNDEVKLYRVDNGVATQLGVTVTQNFSVGDSFGAEMIGSTLQVYRKTAGSWASIASRSDGTYTAAGYIGMYTFSTGANGRLDDFGGGTVVVAGGVTGTAANTLPALTQDAAGELAVTGDAAQTLPALTQDAAGAATVTADAAQTLPALTQDAAGEAAVAGAAAQTLPALVQDAAGDLTVAAAAAQTLPALSQDAAGTVVGAGVTGAVVQTLPALDQSAAGALSVAGDAAQQLPALEQDAAGTVITGVAGEIAQTLPALTQSAAGTVEELELPPAPGPTGGADYGDETSIYGLPPVVGRIVQTLPALRQDAEGVVTRPVTVPRFVVRPRRRGAARSVLPAFTTEASARASVGGEARGELGRLSQRARGHLRVPADLYEVELRRRERAEQDAEMLAVLFMADD